MKSNSIKKWLHIFSGMPLLRRFSNGILRLFPISTICYFALSALRLNADLIDSFQVHAVVDAEQVSDASRYELLQLAKREAVKSYVLMCNDSVPEKILADVQDNASLYVTSSRKLTENWTQLMWLHLTVTEMLLSECAIMIRMSLLPMIMSGLSFWQRRLNSMSFRPFLSLLNDLIQKLLRPETRIMHYN